MNLHRVLQRNFCSESDVTTFIFSSDFLGNIDSQSNIIVSKGHAVVENTSVSYIAFMYSKCLVQVTILMISVISKELVLNLQRYAICPHCYDGKMLPKIDTVRMESPWEQYVC